MRTKIIDLRKNVTFFLFGVFGSVWKFIQRKKISKKRNVWANNGFFGNDVLATIFWPESQEAKHEKSRNLC